jgi:hypothetical protein
MDMMCWEGRVNKIRQTAKQPPSESNGYKEGVFKLALTSQCILSTTSSSQINKPKKRQISAMTTSTTLRLPLSIPDSVDISKQYSVQLTLHGEEQDGDIFFDRYQPSDLTASGEDERSKVLTIPRANLPRFKQDQDMSLKAYFWKGQKLVGAVDLGLV